MTETILKNHASGRLTVRAQKVKIMFFSGILAILADFLTGCAHREEPFQPKHGAVCLTFDDARYQEWIPQMPLFERYHARATFFYNKEITKEAAESMLILRKNGHSIGLHALHHKNCENIDLQTYFDTELKPQLEAAEKYGVKDIRYFAYPNNRHSPESDRFLSQYFARFRAGTNLGLPKGFWIADQEKVFIPLEEIPRTRVMGGCGIGEFYLSTKENLDAALEKAARENKLIVFFSHGISPGATGVHMPTELLEHLLKKADELKMEIIGFDQLPE